VHIHRPAHPALSYSPRAVACLNVFNNCRTICSTRHAYFQWPGWLNDTPGVSLQLLFKEMV